MTHSPEGKVMIHNDNMIHNKSDCIIMQWHDGDMKSHNDSSGYVS